MTDLNAKQRAHLKALAHHLKPVLYIGKEGITLGTMRTIESAFNTRELIKVKVQETAPASAAETGAVIANKIEGAHLVHVIGRTIMLYRRHPENPEIKLPPAKISTGGTAVRRQGTK